MKKRKDLVYPQLSYKITGLLFEVYNELGYGLKEKYYQKAMVEILKEHEMKFEEQVYLPLKFKGVKIGKYYLDFLIEDKVVLELKKGNYFKKTSINQIFEYLVVSKLKLGLLAQFTSSGVRVKRIVNLY